MSPRYAGEAKRMRKKRKRNKKKNDNHKVRNVTIQGVRAEAKGQAQ